MTTWQRHANCSQQKTLNIVVFSVSKLLSSREQVMITCLEATLVPYPHPPVRFVYYGIMDYRVRSVYVVCAYERDVVTMKFYGIAYCTCSGPGISKP